MRPWPPHEIRLARAWRDIGMTNRQVGEALDRTVGAVREMVGRRRNYVRAITKQTIADVSREFGVTAEQIIGRSQTRVIVYARWNVWKRLYDAGLNLSDIGREMNFDHTTIMHALQRIGVTPRPSPPKRQPKQPRRVRGMSSDERRAEVIREYWAKRGVNVTVRVAAASTGKGNGGAVSVIRSDDIPLREGA